VSDAPRKPLRDIFLSLKYRDFSLVWVGMLGWSGAMWMENIARNWLVWKLTGSALDIGLTNLVRSLPQVFLALPAGLAADRFNKKVVLLCCQIVSFAGYLGMFLLVVSGRVEIWHVYVAAGVMGCSMAFNQPARQSLVPRLVPSHLLLNAMGLNHVATNSTRVLGPALGGLLIWKDGGDVRFAYAAAATIFLLVVVTTLLLRGSEGRSLITGGAKKQLLEGISYVIHSRNILSLILTSLVVFTFAMPYNTLLPVISDTVFGIGPGGYGLLLSAAGFGALSGGLAVASMGDVKRKGWLLVGGGVLFGSLLIVLGSVPWVGLAFVVMVLIGASQSLFMTSGNTLILKITPVPLQGRVMSAYHLDHALMPLGSALAGFIADAAGASSALILMGSICLILIFVISLIMPQARRL